MRLVFGISGASGFCLARDMLLALREKGVEIDLVTSAAARRIAAIEGCSVEDTLALADRAYQNDDMAAEISSSTCRTDGMILAPCSLKTLSAVACGYCDTLISRCAENTLRMGRKLLVMPRETPLSAQALGNMRSLALQGAIVMPPVMAYYSRPRTIADINALFVGKALDVFSIDNDYPRWEGL